MSSNAAVPRLIENSFLDASYDCSTYWDVIPLSTTVNNPHLGSSYAEKRQELTGEGRTKEEIEDKILFGCCRAYEEVEEILRDGLHVDAKWMNTLLGNSSKGVTLGKHADLLLRTCYKDGVESCWIVIYKVMLGRVRGVLPIQTPPYREPALEADCHCSFISPSMEDELHIQLAKSQVYIYERNPSYMRRPRQCVPAAVVMYNRLGCPMKAVDLSLSHDDIRRSNQSTPDAPLPVPAAPVREPPSAVQSLPTGCSRSPAVVPLVNGLASSATSDCGTNMAATTSPVTTSNDATTSRDLPAPVANILAVILQQPSQNGVVTSAAGAVMVAPPSTTTTTTSAVNYSADHPRAKYSRLIKPKQPNPRDPRTLARRDPEPAVVPVPALATSAPAPAAVRDPAPVSVAAQMPSAAAATSETATQLLQRQHVVVGDITRQLAADLNNFTSFLRATKPEVPDSAERVALRTMHEINAAFQRLTPICYGYRQTCAYACSTMPDGSPPFPPPDVDRLRRHEAELKQCRDALVDAFDVRQRLMMETPIATEQRRLMFGWLASHWATIVACIDCMIRVMTDVTAICLVSKERTDAAKAAAAAAAASSVASSLPNAVPSQPGSSSQQTVQSMQWAQKVLAPTSGLEIRVPNVGAITSTVLPAMPQPVILRPAMPLMQLAMPQPAPPQPVLPAGVVHTAATVPVSSTSAVAPTSSAGPHVAPAEPEVKPEVPLRVVQPETIIFNADDMTPESLKQAFDEIRLRAIRQLISPTATSSDAVPSRQLVNDADRLPPCLTPAVKMDISDAVEPPVLQPCQPSIQSSAAANATPATGGGCSLPVATIVKQEVVATDAVASPSADVRKTSNTHSEQCENACSVDVNASNVDVCETPVIASSEAGTLPDAAAATSDTGTREGEQENQSTLTASIITSDQSPVSKTSVAYHHQPPPPADNGDDMCKEQLRRLLEARDQRTFSRLLIDSVCSMAPDDFRRVREMLIRKLVENRRRAAAIGDAGHREGSSSLPTSEEGRQRADAGGESSGNWNSRQDDDDGAPRRPATTEDDVYDSELRLKIENVRTCDVDVDGAVDGADSMVDQKQSNPIYRATTSILQEPQRTNGKEAVEKCCGTENDLLDGCSQLSDSDLETFSDDDNQVNYITVAPDETVELDDSDMVECPPHRRPLAEDNKIRVEDSNARIPANTVDKRLHSPFMTTYQPYSDQDDRVHLVSTTVSNGTDHSRAVRVRSPSPVRRRPPGNNAYRRDEDASIVGGSWSADSRHVRRSPHRVAKVNEGAQRRPKDVDVPVSKSARRAADPPVWLHSITESFQKGSVCLQHNFTVLSEFLAPRGRKRLADCWTQKDREDAERDRYISEFEQSRCSRYKRDELVARTLSPRYYMSMAMQYGKDTKRCCPSDESFGLSAIDEKLLLCANADSCPPSPFFARQTAYSSRRLKVLRKSARTIRTTGPSGDAASRPNVIDYRPNRGRLLSHDTINKQRVNKSIRYFLLKRADVEDTAKAGGNSKDGRLHRDTHKPNDRVVGRSSTGNGMRSPINGGRTAAPACEKLPALGRGKHRSAERSSRSLSSDQNNRKREIDSSFRRRRSRSRSRSGDERRKRSTDRRRSKSGSQRGTKSPERRDGDGSCGHSQTFGSPRKDGYQAKNAQNDTNEKRKGSRSVSPRVADKRRKPDEELDVRTANTANVMKVVPVAMEYGRTSSAVNAHVDENASRRDNPKNVSCYKSAEESPPPNTCAPAPVASVSGRPNYHNIVIDLSDDEESDENNCASAKTINSKTPCAANATPQVVARQESPTLGAITHGVLDHLSHARINSVPPARTGEIGPLRTACQTVKVTSTAESTQSAPCRPLFSGVTTGITRTVGSPLFTYQHPRTNGRSMRLFDVDAGDGGSKSQNAASVRPAAAGAATGVSEPRPVVFVVTGLTKGAPKQLSSGGGKLNP